MGMYFNSDQTVKMVQRVNRHFAARSEGGKIGYWKRHPDFFAQGSKLYETAAKNGVIVDPSDDDDDNSHNNNWMAWLDALHKYPDPDGGYIGDTLCRYIYEALTDQKLTCREIVFAVVPDATYIKLDKPIPIPVGKTKYTLLLIIHTVEVDKVPTALRRAVALRKKEKAKNKKKI